MSPSPQSSKIRNWAQTFLAFTPILAMAWFFIANGGDLDNFFDQGYSWTYMGTLIGFGLIIPFVPYHEALKADLASTVMLALIQLTLAYITDWSGLGALTFSVILKFGIPFTCLIVIGMLVARLQKWLEPNNERTIEAQNNFWASSIGGTAGTAVVLICLTVLSFWIWSGGTVTDLFGATIYPTILMFAVFLLAGNTMAWVANQALRRRWDKLGLSTSIERFREFPEHIVRDVVEAESKLSQTELGHMNASVTVVLGVALITQILFGDVSIWVFMGGSFLMILYMFIVVLRFRANYKAAWYEAVRSRVGETELLKQASRKSGLGWPDETNE
ncbi:MAG: hypothetical protein JNL09_02990 [Anaerolineales bacterium]|nr:hypothetical protein [Anaerolineales bacterium]